MDHDFNRDILKETAHRPWTMPDAPWVMRQTWRDLLFAHWRLDPNALRSKIPVEFSLDLFGGAAWIGVVPFRMTNVAPRGVPSLPGISEFPELNVRTYVVVNGKPGVYFFSLDADNVFAVRAARTLFNLPYYKAAMSLEAAGGEYTYRCARDGNGAAFEGSYRPAGATFLPTTGSLEYFLTERYCLYNVDRRGRAYRLDIHHPPWTLQPAHLRLARNTMADASGVSLPAEPPLLHFASRQDMVGWRPDRLR